MMNQERFRKHYQSGPHFRLENPNPRWAQMRGFVWNTGDCVIRALANATSGDWLDAFDYLTRKARRDFAVVNDAGYLRKWLVEDGAVWTPLRPQKGKKRMTVLQFAEAHPVGHFILSIANHETACVDGVILDAFNCGDSCLDGYLDLADFSM